MQGTRSAANEPLHHTTPAKPGAFGTYLLVAGTIQDGEWISVEVRFICEFRERTGQKEFHSANPEPHEAHHYHVMKFKNPLAKNRTPASQKWTLH